MITVVDVVKRDAEAHRIDRPAPLGHLEVLVLNLGQQLAGGLRGHLALVAHDVSHVVADRNIVDGTGLEDLEVTVFHLDVNAVIAEKALDVVGILALDLDIGEEPVEVILEQHLELVLGLGGLGVVLKTAEHVADMCLGVDLTQLDDSFGGRDKLVVRDLELLGPAPGIGVGAVLVLIPDNTAAGAGVGIHVVNLVEGHPVLDLTLVATEERLGVMLEGVDNVTARETVILLCQVERHIEMVEGNHGLNAVLVALIEHLIVEGQTLLVWKNTAPGDAHTEDAEAHLAEERNVLLVGVVEINATTLGKIVGHLVCLASGKGLTRHGVERAALDNTLAGTRLAVEQDDVVRDGRSASTLVPGAFDLVGRRSAAPEEALREGIAKVISRKINHAMSSSLNGRNQ